MNVQQLDLETKVSALKILNICRGNLPEPLKVHGIQSEMIDCMKRVLDKAKATGLIKGG